MTRKRSLGIDLYALRRMRHAFGHSVKRYAECITLLRYALRKMRHAFGPSVTRYAFREMRHGGGGGGEKYVTKAGAICKLKFP